MRPKLKVWVVFKDSVKFGDGRAQLLELVDQLGSLKRAVEHFGMSYRNAWGYLRELEKAAGFKILERQPGGGPRSGMRLTKRGREFLARYRQFRRDVDTGVARRFQQAFRQR
ncbi:MAG TPA: LysR family transcriptional regulator [Candidatus Methylomirabilis sp.]|nr:LysR family transcriptional regulator [Candidatus Methylomirabilis sp.]